MGKHAVFGAIGLVVGLLAGFLIATAITPVRPQPGAASDVARNDNVRALTDDAPLDHSPVVPTMQPAASRGSLVADLFANADIPAVPAGVGVITGSVLTGAGQPVPGVKIEASTDYPDEDRNDEDTPENRILARIRYERWMQLATRDVTTGADGRYSIEGLEQGVEYSISADAKGWEVDRKAGYGAVKAGAVCDFVAEPVLALAVRVFLPGGAPAQYGDVECVSSGGRNNYDETIARGACAFELRPGKWTLSATSGKYSEMVSAPVEVTVVDGVAPEPVDIHLKGSAGIVGSVKVPAAIRGYWLEIHLQPNPPAEAPAPEFDDDQSGLSSQSGSSFEFVGIASGRYRVLLVYENEVQDWKDVAVSDALVEVELAMPELDRADYIIVRAFDPAGQLINDCDFSIGFNYQGGSSSSSGGEIEQGDGSYWLSKQGVSGRARLNGADKEGWYEVTVTSTEYGTKEFRYETTDTHELEARFVKPAWVTLTVANFNENPYRAKLRWSLVHAETGGSSRRSGGGQEAATTGSPFRLGPTEPGEYDLVLKFEGSRWDDRELSLQRVVLVAGDNALAASVPTLYTLTITGEDESVLRWLDIRVKGAPFPIYGYDQEVRQGAMKVEAIPAGVYALSSDTGRVEVVVSSDTTVKFDPPEFDCVVLLVEDRADIEALGLYNGDKLLEVDGVKVSDEGLAWTHTQASMARESTTWRVQRNGVPVDVTLDGRELQKLLDMESDGEFDMNPGYLAG